ncbi:MAG: hypothetical protein EOO38_20360 [Cytophagaceae bacterium]|nr:MAG: hypothetical protein EOO38_20360 [Cytophagaceae bacterium]
MSALSLCCAYARDAASEGRFRAAHGLFQTAIHNFDRAQKVTQRADESSFHDWSLHDQTESTLISARAELDECAKLIYPTDTH